MSSIYADLSLQIDSDYLSLARQAEENFKDFITQLRAAEVSLATQIDVDYKLLAKQVRDGIEGMGLGLDEGFESHSCVFMIVCLTSIDDDEV